MKRLLCWLGIHDWKYEVNYKIFPYRLYRYCSKCGEIQSNFKLK